MSFFLTFFVFFLFFWAANVSDLSRSQLWNMELDFGWTRYMYKAEHKSWRSLLFIVFHCVCHTFSCIFWQASHKKLEKKNQASKKNSKFEFCWIKRAPKNKCARQLWDIGFIFLALHMFLFQINQINKIKHSGSVSWKTKNTICV